MITSSDYKDWDNCSRIGRDRSLDRGLSPGQHHPRSSGVKSKKGRHIMEAEEAGKVVAGLDQCLI